jgi:hypothetical protein
MNLSNCCAAPAKVDCADEGTCCYMCEKCGKACDVVNSCLNTALFAGLTVGGIDRSTTDKVLADGHLTLDIIEHQFEAMSDGLLNASLNGFILGVKKALNTKKGDNNDNQG